VSDRKTETNRRQSDSARAKGRQTLTRENVIRAATELLDSEGVEHLSMRSLATALGTGPSTLYWHVHDKEDLLLLILDETVRPIRVPVHGSWDFRLEETLLRCHEALLPRPALVDILWRSAWHLGPEVLRVADSLVGLVAESGLPEAEIGEAYLALITLLYGYVMAQRSSPGNPSYREMLDTSPDSPSGDLYPNLIRYGPGAVRDQGQFRYAVEMLIDTIKVRAAAAKSVPLAKRTEK
jgi:TetR/AcrR family tetracycline transcriptional repressor